MTISHLRNPYKRLVKVRNAVAHSLKTDKKVMEIITDLNEILSQVSDVINRYYQGK